MFLTPRLGRLLTTSLRPTSRSLSTTSHLRSATPDWQALIGGREGVDRKRKVYEEKYATALVEKAKQEGVSVEELKERKAAELQAEALRKREELAKAVEVPGLVEAGGEGAQGETVVRPLPSAESVPAAKSSQGSSPVKPLADILDLSKAATLTTTEISQLWTTYHQAKGFLSAAIPTETYARMMLLAKKYPLFVLPLAREIVGDLPEELPEGSNGAVEMHLLEWAFLPPPSTVLEPVPSPSTVLFTPLAEYKSRQSFAQPYLILTHYTDLSLSHNVVLMRGELSDNVALNAVDAQVLAVRLQLFYNHTGKGGEREEARKQLLEDFHERPEEFDLEKLIKTAWELPA